MDRTWQIMAKEAIEKEIFTGAAIGLYSGRNKRVTTKYFGTLSKEDRREVGEDCFFDLASLTKPMQTSLLFMGLVSEGFSLETTVQDIYGKDVSQVFFDGETTISDLLLHQSGLIDHRKYYEIFQEPSKELVVESILGDKPVYKRGEDSKYSDLGFILLGDILEKISGKGLPELWMERVAIPLGIEDEFVYSGEGIVSDAEKLIKRPCLYTTSLVDKSVHYSGEVHDDNCRVMGGNAGHAGLFGSINGSLKLYISLLKTYLGTGTFPFINRDVLINFWTRRTGSRWALGFDTPSAVGSSSGRYFDKKSVGHLGFTGTSFWIDPVKEIIIALFTNRAYYGDSLTAMKAFRPKIHDAIMEDLLEDLSTK